VRRRWKDLAPSAVQTQDPETKVSPRLKVTVGLLEIEAVEFAMRSSVRAPTLAHQLSVFYIGSLPRGVPEVDECVKDRYSEPDRGE
jgi:hypothetical protein